MQVRAALATAEIEVKWSGVGAKLASQSSGAGGTVPTAWCAGAGSSPVVGTIFSNGFVSFCWLADILLT